MSVVVCSATMLYYGAMNLHDFILSNDLADTDPVIVSERYITAVADLDLTAQVAALEPSVRPHAGRIASSIRKAQRGGPAHTVHDSHTGNGGPAHTTNDGQEEHGGPAHGSRDSQGRNGGPAPAWAQKNAKLIAWCWDHQGDHFYIPSAGGRRKLVEITAPEWESRARWLSQSAEGSLRSAGESRAYASLIVDAGAETLAGVLEQVTA